MSILENIEVEKKYIVKNPSVFKEVEKLIIDLDGHKIDISGEAKVQKDYYYDTLDLYLLNKDKGLRFREIEGKLKLTIKIPTGKYNKPKNGLYTQKERFEYEVEVDSKDKEKNRKEILKYLPELKESRKWNNLNKTLTVINNRRTIKLSKDDVEFEIVFDDVEYINVNGKKEKEYEVEIELKSDYSHRKDLKVISDYLEENILGLEESCESKYRRGLELTK